MRKLNYKEKLEEDRAALAANGHVSDRYSGIASIQFKMTYYHRSLDPVLMTRTLSFSPDAYAGFHMKCMSDGCTNGGFDLAPVVDGLVKAGKRSVKGRLPCQGKNMAPGHASLAYEINIVYSGRGK